MLKKSLIATALIIALTGCGGSDSSNDSSNNPPANPPADNIEITAFDGYLKNAVAFIDINKDGKFDISDKVLGLTNESGKITIEKPTSGIIAIQTLILGSPVQMALAAKDPKYKNTYTIDLDFPDQPVSKELVFSAPSTSKVISPITDLVVLELLKSNDEITEDRVKEAVLAVQTSLQQKDQDLFKDFVANAKTDDNDALMHKTAQILATSKSIDLDEYVKSSLVIAETVGKEVIDIANDSSQDIRDKSIVPIITVDTDGNANKVANSKIMVDIEEYTYYKEILLYTSKDLKEGDSFLFEFSHKPFIDADFKGEYSNPLIIDSSIEKLHKFGITVDQGPQQNNGPMISSNKILKAGTVNITIEGIDIDSDGNEVGTARIEFSLEIK